MEGIPDPSNLMANQSSNSTSFPPENLNEAVVLIQNTEEQNHDPDSSSIANRNNFISSDSYQENEDQDLLSFIKHANGKLWERQKMIDLGKRVAKGPGRTRKNPYCSSHQIKSYVYNYFWVLTKYRKVIEYF